MGDAIYEIQVDDTVCRLNTNTSIKVVSKKVDIKPTPLIEVNKAVYNTLPDKRKGFHLPDDYVVYSGKEGDIDEDEVEYDVDDEDIVWLRLVNERRAKEKLKPISEKILEKAIDRFEKESYFHNTEASRPPTVDNDAVCCICEDGDDSNVNQIIFCDMCNIAVHQECYGVPYIPAGQWLCRRCQLSPSEPVKCVFCPYQNGAFKQTSDNRWAHVVCALWLSEVHFANAVFLEPVEGVAFSLKRRAKLTCLVCKIKMGACLQCSKKSCVRPFHVTCAMHAGLHMKVETEEKAGSEDTIVNRFAFCHQHSAQITKTMPATMAAFKRNVADSVKKARKILNNSNRQNPQIAVPVVPAKKLKELRKQFDVAQLEDVLNYWSLKRRSRCGVPLLRRLQVYHSRKQLGRRSTDGPLNVQTEDQICDVPLAGVDKNTANLLYRTGKLRNNLEKLRLLIELTKKREKYKLEMVGIYRTIIENALMPSSEILETLLDKLAEKDHQKIFAEPVTEAEVPGYRKIIKKPMDFAKMRLRLEKGEYKRVADLRADFELMMDNCARFNKDNMYFWRYGHQMRSLGMKLIKSAEQDEHHCSSGKLLPGALSVLFDEKDPELADLRSSVNDEDDVEESKPTPKSASPDRRKSRSANMKETKILDFFRPLGNDYQPSTSVADSPPPKRRRVATNSSSAAGSPKQTGRSLRHTAHVEYAVTDDEEDETEGATSNDDDYGRRRKRKRMSLKKGKNSHEKSSHSDNRRQFAHDDVVWATRDNERMPARVFDRAMIALETDKAIVERAKKIPVDTDPNKTLVVFFDLDKSLRYVPTDELEHCDVRARLTNDESIVTAALRRAKDFWDRYFKY